jgi:hypothetical protein
MRRRELNPAAILTQTKLSLVNAKTARTPALHGRCISAARRDNFCRSMTQYGTARALPNLGLKSSWLHTLGLIFPSTFVTLFCYWSRLR